MGEPLVSIVMNCFNGEEHLRPALASVLEQTYQNWEVVFWDNQSTDDSANVFKSHEDRRFRYFCAESHTPLGEARNRALVECRGDLIAFLDVDDWWVPQKLELQVPLFRDESVGMSCGGYILVNEREPGQSIRQPASQSLPNGQILNNLFDEFFVHFSNFVVRKKALESLAYLFDPRFNIIEDFDIVVRLSVNWKMASVQVPISYYRWHGNNTGYRTDFLIGKELKDWYDASSGNSLYRSQENFLKFERKVHYYDLLRMLYTGKKAEALRRLKNVTLGQRIKGLVGILLPTQVVRRRMNRS